VTLPILLLVLGVAALVGSWFAYGLLIKALDAHHPDVYEQLGRPTAAMAFWYYRLPLRPKALGSFEKYIWGLQFRTLSGRAARALGWAIVLGRASAILMLILAIVLRET
jgi:hypothetical protein